MRPPAESPRRKSPGTSRRAPPVALTIAPRCGSVPRDAFVRVSAGVLACVVVALFLLSSVGSLATGSGSVPGAVTPARTGTATSPGTVAARPSAYGPAASSAARAALKTGGAAWLTAARPALSGSAIAPDVSSPVAYSLAASRAISAAVTTEGGQWSIDVSVGERLLAPEVISSGELGFECPYSWVSTPTASIYLAATPSSALAGTSNFYLMLLSSSNGNSSLFAAVENGTAELLFLLQLPCGGTYLPPYDGYLPTGLIDSPAAVAKANASGGRAFLTDHPSAVQEWDAESFPGFGGGPVWAVVDLTTCGGLFEAIVGGLNGTVLFAENFANSTCTYAVTFTEAGLAAGTDWSATVGYEQSSTAASITFYLPNGSESYSIPVLTGYTAAPSSGTISVAGLPLSKTITFTRGAGYRAVTFTESGLAAGAYWNATLEGIGTIEGNQSHLSFTVTAGTYSYAVNATNYSASPASGSVTVSTSDQGQAVAFTPYAVVTFAEVGLPYSQVLWDVTVGGVLHLSNASRIRVREPVGTYAFGVDVPTGFVATPAGGSVVVGSTNLTRTIAVSRAAGFYAVRFREEGLPSDFPFAAEVNGSHEYVVAPWNLSWTLANGTYNFEVDPSAGAIPVPETGVVKVAGADQSVTIVFSNATYLVTFGESGLTAGTVWEVTLDGTPELEVAPTDVVFTELNGTFPYSVASSGWVAKPASGELGVAGGPVTVFVSFSRVLTYPVTFRESGLLSNAIWNVTFNGTQFHSLSGNATLSLPEPNGSYSFNVTAPTGYRAEPAAGWANVSGAGVSETIVFGLAPGYYAVTFQESGLPSGTSWRVELNATGQNASVDTIAFVKPDGEYGFSVSIGTAGWVAVPPSGEIDVSGASVVQEITFSLAPGYFFLTFHETGLPNGSEWSVLATGARSYEGSVAAPSPVTLEVPNGTYAYAASSANSSFAEVYGNASVEGLSLNVTVAFHVRTYAVTFVSEGLPAGIRWWVNITGLSSFTNGSLSNVSGPLRIDLPDGNYGFTVGSANLSWRASGAAFSVTGAPKTLTVTFSLVTYSVVVSETGLPAGTLWWVNVTGGESYFGTHAQIEARAPNGTAKYSLASADKSWAAPPGSFTVRGAAQTVDVTFTLQTFDVTVTETGLAAGVPWYVNVSGQPSERSTARTLDLVLANGTYDYTVGVGSLAYIVPLGLSGILTVSGAGHASVAFVAAYSVTFERPSGSPNDTEWSVNLSGAAVYATSLSPLGTSLTKTSFGATIVFYEPNGSYGYTVRVSSSSGYSDSSTVGVQGSAVTVVPSAVGTSSPSNLLHGWLLYALAGAVVVAVVAVAAAVLRRRGAPPPTGQDPSSSSSPGSRGSGRSPPPSAP